MENNKISTPTEIIEKGVRITSPKKNANKMNKYFNKGLKK